MPKQATVSHAAGGPRRSRINGLTHSGGVTRTWSSFAEPISRGVGAALREIDKR